jgi:hypothetical protein
MITPIPNSDYMLLFRGTNWDKELSPEEIQQVVADWMDWFQGLVKEGKCLSGHPLTSEGKLVSGDKGRVVADGPFAESKEAIGGYFYLRVGGFEEALEIAKRCPGLKYGVKVEVRPVAEICGVRARAADAERAPELAEALA